MGLSVNVITRLLNLANKILAEHGEELVSILRDAVTALPAPVNPPVTPPPGPVVPIFFDEVYYRTAYPDVDNAIKLGYFTSGYDHYVKHGKAEGRNPTPPIEPPLPPVKPPVNPPDPHWAPKDSYSSVEALRANLLGKGFTQYVGLDGMEIQSGFGPAYNYFMWRDGSVRREKPAGTNTPPVVRKPGDKLLAEYPDKEALLADVGAVRWSWAVLLDGDVIRPGFEADEPAGYFTHGGKVVKR